MNSSTSWVSTSRSIESTSAKRLKRNRTCPPMTGLEGKRSEIAETQNVRSRSQITVNEISLRGVVVGPAWIFRYRQHWHRHARRIGERQIALRRHRFGRRDFQFSRAGPAGEIAALPGR